MFHTGDSAAGILYIFKKLEPQVVHEFQVVYDSRN